MRRLAALLLLAGASAAQAQVKSDWERRDELRHWQEIEVALPPFPGRDDRLVFLVDAASGFRFLVDRPSIAAGSDGVVRFALVALSPQGAENISFEGVRCKSGEHKLYAIGRADGSWSPREGTWRRATQRWQQVVRTEFFCPQGVPIASAAEGIDALRRGGHPRKGPVHYD